MTKYHEAAHTLDANIELPEIDELAPSAGHDEQMAEQVKAQSDEFREQANENAEAQAERDREWDERDPKPTPTEFLAEKHNEPRSDDDERQPAVERQGDGVPEGTVQDVLDWVGDDQDRARQALDAEREGQNRQTLIAELEKRVV